MLILHGYWLSLATYRVRAALLLKGIAFEERMRNLAQGDQHTDHFRTINPAGTVPALEGAASFPLTQSLAIFWNGSRTHIHRNPCCRVIRPDVLACALSSC